MTHLAIDCGTTAVKGAIVEDDLTMTAHHGVAIPTQVDGATIEQDPADWWSATADVVDALPVGGVETVVVTGQIQDVVCWRDDAPTRAAILYTDRRATVEHDHLESVLGTDRWFAITGNQQDAGNVAAKLRWLADHDPAALTGATVLLGAHSTLVARMTGVPACDPTTAATTGLMDLATRAWSEEVLEAVGVDVSLPDLVAPSTSVGSLRPDAAGELGLPAGLPVVHAAGDAGTTTVGSGVQPGETTSVYLGTSGWVATTSDHPGRPRPEVFTLPHPQTAGHITIGPMLSVGANVDWARSLMAPNSASDQLDRLVAGNPDPVPLVYMPHLAGERSPMMDPDIRAAIIGIGPSTDASVVLRAVLQGVAHGLHQVEELLRADSTGEVLLSGGGSRSDVWCQVVADVFGRPVTRLAGTEYVGMVGAVACVVHPTGDPPVTPDRAEQFAPDRERHRTHRVLADLHRRAWPRLRNTMHALAALRHDLTTT